MAQDNKPKARIIETSDNDNRLVGDALQSMSIDSVRRLVIEMEAVIVRQTK